MAQLRETSKATPVGPGEPVESSALSQLGATFAERAKAKKKAEQRRVSDKDTEDKAVKQASKK